MSNTTTESGMSIEHRGLEEVKGPAASGDQLKQPWTGLSHHTAEDTRIPIPQMPGNIQEADVSRELLSGLALRIANSVPQFTTGWMADQMKLSVPIVNDLMEELVDAGFVEGLGAVGFLNFRYRILSLGHEMATGLTGTCAYTGAAPVSLSDYVQMVRLQNEYRPEVTAARIEQATSELVLDEKVRRTVGLAMSSGRSLFMFGPAGNGKSTLGHRLHEATDGCLWIPRAISVDNQIIKLYDPKWHKKYGGLKTHHHDARWICIHRPLITVGGELSPEDLEFSFDRRRKVHEAPLHLKANGGTFFVDDFGRQQADPSKFLNRWIVPMESGVDILTLATGDKIQVPFQMMLIVATNLDPQAIVDPAYLRRMGYRVLLATPTPEQFREIFRRYADRCRFKTPEGFVDGILKRMACEGRELRCCQPRDLIERMRDAIRYLGSGGELTSEALEIAWTGYFGNWNTATRGAR